METSLIGSLQETVFIHPGKSMRTVKGHEFLPRTDGDGAGCG